MRPVSRAYYKLKYALEEFGISLKGKICADFGSNIGGFVQAILEEDPKRVYSVETSKRLLHFELKDDSRVVFMGGTNAIGVKLPEKCDFISIDVGWTPQKIILENAIKNLKSDGIIISLIKPFYELNKTSPNEKEIKEVLNSVSDFAKKRFNEIKIIESPIKGQRKGNKEYLMFLRGLKQN